MSTSRQGLGLHSPNKLELDTRQARERLEFARAQGDGPSSLQAGGRRLRVTAARKAGPCAGFSRREVTNSAVVLWDALPRVEGWMSNMTTLAHPGGRPRRGNAIPPMMRRATAWGAVGQCLGLGKGRHSCATGVPANCSCGAPPSSRPLV